MKKLLATLAAATLPIAAFAQATLPAVEAEVRKVDLDRNNITLKHGDIPNVDMPAMTMVFRVKDSALLQKVKAGDKVKFTVDKVDETLTVMSIEVEKP